MEMKVRERERVKGEMNLCEMMRRKECEKGEIFRKIVLEYSLTGDICSINETIQQIIQKGRIFKDCLGVGGERLHTQFTTHPKGTLYNTN